ncbi:MAG: phosphoadenosine phosphosulfate reductase [Acetobacteraceae bacterium]|nr:phosphoadenosine phosphosulfate reductase [Acetobacteraceae bacterium]
MCQPSLFDSAATSKHSLLPLSEYRKIIISFSGGKDSTACVLRCLDLGVRPDQLELWHQDVDGREEPFMDWPVTPAYCRAFAAAFGLPLRFQWRVGGFVREMFREQTKTAPVRFERADGTIGEAGGEGPLVTRLLWPQVAGIRNGRWCTPKLKIDVAAVALNNDPAYAEGPLLFVTGERWDESTPRSKIPAAEPHRCHTSRRRVDHWHGACDLKEADVWELIRRHRVRVHPAYYLGWGRVSCLACIFGDYNQWASVRELVPALFDRIAGYEQRFGKTIKQRLSVVNQADRGEAFAMPVELRAKALSTDYTDPILLPDGEEWVLPPGAFRRCGGPT